MDQESKYQAFGSYNFDSDEKWHQFLDTVEINGDLTAPVVLRLKKKYYQRNIDQDFDVNYVISSTRPSQNTSGSNSQQQSQQQTDSQQQTSSSTPPTGNSGSSPMLPLKSVIYSVLCALALLSGVIALSLSFFNPMSPTAFQWYQRATFALTALFASEFLATYGFHFSTVSKVQQDSNGQYAMLGLILVLGYPHVSTMFLFNVLLMSLYLLSYHACVLASSGSSYSIVRMFVKPIARRLERNVLRRESTIMFAIAVNEFLLLISQIVSLFTPFRSFMIILMVLNFTQMRYVTSNYLQMVFYQVRVKLDDWAARYMPSLVASLWYKFRDVLSGFAEQLLLAGRQRQAQQQAQQ